MSTTADGPDRIEREIHIDAPVDRVWSLVSEPGWWIGDGDRSGRTSTREGDVVIVDDPRYGRFPVLPVSADEPHHLAYRSAYPGEAPVEGTSTLVEFFLSETDGGTLLRVVESGFTNLAGSAHEPDVEGDARGWEMQLGVAKQHAERVRT